MGDAKNAAAPAQVKPGAGDKTCKAGKKPRFVLKKPGGPHGLVASIKSC